MPNTRISDLTAATSVAGTDVYPSVQTAGVGPVKTSLTQITAFALANAPAGAVATPSIAPTGDTNTGFWFPAADTIAASTNGSERMRITSAGNVGIGTTSPSSILNVVSSAACIVRLKGGTSNTQSSAVFFTCTGSGNTLGAIGDRSTINGGAVDQEFQIYAGLDNASTPVPLTVSVGGSERMRITSAGNLLLNSTTTGRSGIVIGNTAGGVSLDGTGGTYANWGGSYGIYTRTGVGLGIGSAFAISFEVNGTPGGAATEAMRITSAGNVGIGTTSPGAALDVFGNIYISNATTSGGAALVGRAVGSNTWIVGPDNSINGGTDQGLSLYSYGATNVRFYTNATERMRITSTGNVLIGTTSSPTTGTQCLTIETETAPTATPADTVTFYSSDLSAGNTMPSFYTEGTIVGTGTPTADRTIAVRINGTVYYLLASTIP